MALEIGDQAFEQCPHPLAIEQLVDVGIDRRFVPLDLAFGRFEIERHDAHAAATLQAVLGLA